MNTLKVTLFLVGTSIGAGFITGAELVRFFSDGYLPALFLSCLLYFCGCSFFLSLGRKYGGYGGAMRALFGAGAPVAEGMLLLIAFVPCAGMLAALDALIPSARPFASLAGLFVILCFSVHGTKGIALLNAVLVPLLLAFVFIYGRGEPVRSEPMSASGAVNAVLYTGMNLIFALPAFCEMGREARRPVCSSAIAVLLVFSGAVCILSAVFRAGGDVAEAEMPFLSAVRGHRVFFGAVACAVLTSLASSMFPLLAACGKFHGAKKYAAGAVVLLAAFLLSGLGLSGVVRVLYPAVGMLGVFFSALCVLDEYLFKKYHQKIHARRQYAQDKGRAHHKVEFEHLPAVYDEVSQPRARYDIFSHDRPDPRHADVDLEHGNDGRI